ncbi:MULTISPECIES: tyrosine-type recombinase/integrase [Vibrio]|uniref:tyrosine-type recombinase/integrase n=1 Tax=Vibrio TaxID=662 RepID=UPI001482D76F|nr:MULTISPECIES: site-specific integrase [unclassified Vibrio]EJK2107547.1 site-specific integrase [Vibrio cholerae]EJL6548742.1 site-specific integrase [Vibrio cholerae]EKF9237517.1 site-specific integrase [Vibrio cholerae]MDQ2190376.1 site-specific integrase [Vibrio sp. A14(2019)]MDQ2196146.1 site-specific integrase [Vibrio sp. 2017_1457_11]
MKVTYEDIATNMGVVAITHLPVFWDRSERIMSAGMVYVIEKIESGFWSSMDTVRSNATGIEQFVSFLEEQNVPFKDVQIKHIFKWRNRLVHKSGHGRRVTNRTINVRLRAVVRFIEWAILNNYTQDSFWGLRVEKLIRTGQLNFNQKQQAQQIRSIRLLLTEFIYRDPLPTMEEIERFSKKLPKYIRPMMGLMLGTGMRISEVLSAPVSAFPSYTSVLNDPNRMYSIRLDTRVMNIKNDKTRTVFIPGRLLLAIYEQVMSSSFSGNKSLFFANENHQAWASSTIQKSFKSTSDLAGLRYSITPHTLRHVFATRTLEKWQESGFSSEMACLIWLQKQLGHSLVSTTANIYINMTSELHAHDRKVLQQYEQELCQMMQEADDE